MYDRARAQHKDFAVQLKLCGNICWGQRHDVRRMCILFAAVCIVSAQHMIKPTV